MYKVFFNERVVYISVQKNETLFNNDMRNGFYESELTANSPINSLSPIPIFQIAKTADFKCFWADFIADNRLLKVKLEGKSGIQLNEILNSFFHIVKAAGGVVFNSKEQMLFIERLGKWDLPKGKIDKGENAEEAAIREVKEETGVLVSPNIKKAGTTFHIYASPYHNGEWVLKPTYWFEMQAIDSSGMTPQLSENISNVCWFNPSKFEVILSNTYASLKDIVLRYKK